MQCRQQGGGFGVAVFGGALEPVCPVTDAAGHAGPFEIGAADKELGPRLGGLREGDEELERPGPVAGGDHGLRPLQAGGIRAEYARKFAEYAAHGSRKASVVVGMTRAKRYSTKVRRPIRISAVICMPGEGLKSAGTPMRPRDSMLTRAL